LQKTLSKWRIKSKLCNRAVGSKKEGYFVSIEGHEAKYNLDGFSSIEYRTLPPKVASDYTKTFIGSWVK
jgi:hypothetical protein